MLNIWSWLWLDSAVKICLFDDLNSMIMASAICKGYLPEKANFSSFLCHSFFSNLVFLLVQTSIFLNSLTHLSGVCFDTAFFKPSLTIFLGSPLWWSWTFAARGRHSWLLSKATTFLKSQHNIFKDISSLSSQDKVTIFILLIKK